MPPKVKISKSDIVDISLEIIKSSGEKSLNAREIAKNLGCSTQPIFSNYKNMDELKKDVISRVSDIYLSYREIEVKSGKYPYFKASGMAYIKFAREEKELFKLLYMRDRSGEFINESQKGDSEVIEAIMLQTGFSEELAKKFLIEMWIYVHGIATMIATSYLKWDDETVSDMLTDAFEGLKKRFKEI